jgi:hypothetical protein
MLDLIEQIKHSLYYSDHVKWGIKNLTPGTSVIDKCISCRPILQKPDR